MSEIDLEKFFLVNSVVLCHMVESFEEKEDVEHKEMWAYFSAVFDVEVDEAAMPEAQKRFYQKGKEARSMHSIQGVRWVFLNALNPDLERPVIECATAARLWEGGEAYARTFMDVMMKRYQEQ